MSSSSAEARKLAAKHLRTATERFCKLMVIKGREAQGTVTPLSELNLTLGALIPMVDPMLTQNGGDPGKLKVIPGRINPGNHDDAVPEQADLKADVRQPQGLPKALSRLVRVSAIDVQCGPPSLSRASRRSTIATSFGVVVMEGSASSDGTALISNCSYSRDRCGGSDRIVQIARRGRVPRIKLARSRPALRWADSRRRRQRTGGGASHEPSAARSSAARAPAPRTDGRWARDHPSGRVRRRARTV